MAEDQLSVKVPVASFLKEGMPVFDNTGKKIGHVRGYNLEAGYVLVEGGALRRHDYYIPLDAVRAIDRRELVLAMAEDRLARDAAAPPEARVIPERPQAAAAAADGVSAVVWHEVPSGYDGSAVEVAPVDVAAVGRRVHVGMTALDLLEDYVGDITRLDRTRDLLVVEHAYDGTPPLYIPFDAVASVHDDEEVVRLLRPRASLVEDCAAPPGAASSPEAEDPGGNVS